MTGPVLRPDIGLHFDDLSREDTAIDHSNEILADERSRNRNRWAIEILRARTLLLTSMNMTLDRSKRYFYFRPPPSGVPLRIWRRERSWDHFTAVIKVPRHAAHKRSRASRHEMNVVDRAVSLLIRLKCKYGLFPFRIE